MLQILGYELAGAIFQRGDETTNPSIADGMKVKYDVACVCQTLKSTYLGTGQYN